MDKRFHKRSLAALYLDQTFIAGTGNYLRSEILHQSGVHPFDRPCDLTRKQLGLLARNHVKSVTTGLCHLRHHQHTRAGSNASKPLAFADHAIGISLSHEASSPATAAQI